MRSIAMFLAVLSMMNEGGPESNEELTRPTQATLQGIGPETITFGRDDISVWLRASSYFKRKVKKAFKSDHSPQSEVSVPFLRVSEVTPAGCQIPEFGVLQRPRLIFCRMLVSGALDTCKGPYPPGTQGREGHFNATHILRRSIVHEHSGGELMVLQHIATGTIDTIKRHTKLPASIMDDAGGIIDNPENGIVAYTPRYTVHWLNCVPPGFVHFAEVHCQDHSRAGIQLPDPRFITLHAAVAYVLHLRGAAQVMDKVYDALFDQGLKVLSVLASKISFSDSR
ncbi:hypothetical protein EDB19DRAFT_1835858 [Suillus lakei]|nr:hypothetical protein EDB19DRAFT_1835858 [Suillus lakei]